MMLEWTIDECRERGVVVNYKRNAVYRYKGRTIIHSTLYFITNGAIIPTS